MPGRLGFPTLLAAGQVGDLISELFMELSYPVRQQGKVDQDIGVGDEE